MALNPPFVKTKFSNVRVNFVLENIKHMKFLMNGILTDEELIHILYNYSEIPRKKELSTAQKEYLDFCISSIEVNKLWNKTRETIDSICTEIESGARTSKVNISLLEKFYMKILSFRMRALPSEVNDLNRRVSSALSKNIKLPHSCEEEDCSLCVHYIRHEYGKPKCSHYFNAINTMQGIEYKDKLPEFLKEHCKGSFFQNVNPDITILAPNNNIIRG